MPTDADAPARAAFDTIMRRDNLVALIEQTASSRTSTPHRSPGPAASRTASLAARQGDDRGRQARYVLGMLEKRFVVSSAASWQGEGTVSIGVEWPDAVDGAHAGSRPRSSVHRGAPHQRALQHRGGDLHPRRPFRAHARRAGREAAIRSPSHASAPQTRPAPILSRAAPRPATSQLERSADSTTIMRCARRLIALCSQSVSWICAATEAILLRRSPSRRILADASMIDCQRVAPVRRAARRTTCRAEYWWGRRGGEVRGEKRGLREPAFAHERGMAFEMEIASRCWRAR